MDCFICFSKNNSLLSPATLSSFASHQRWDPSPFGVLKLNSDGSVKENGRLAGCGGILRDHHGDFVIAFAKRLHACSVLDSELHGIPHGVQLARHRGCTKLIVEMDSCVAFELLVNKRHGEEPSQRLVDSIAEIGEDGEMEFNWQLVGREFNVVADRHAKHSHDINGSSIIYTFVPSFIAKLLIVDKLGPNGSIVM